MEEFATGVWPEQPVAAPKAGHKGQRRPPPPRTASADAPTEVTTAPTTPMPRAGMKIPVAKKKKSGMGMVVAAVVVVAAGVGGYFALTSKQGSPTSSAAPPPAAVTPTETAPVAAPPAPPPPPPQQAPRRTPPRQVATPPAPPAAPAEEWGYLIIDATPVPGTVFIDGVNAGDTPVYNYRVKPGLHTIRIQSEGYRTLTDRLQVNAGNPVRKRYPLIPE